MNPYLAEFIGTTLLLIFGNGVVANVVLARTKGHGSGWIVIAAGWGFAVFIGAFCAAPFSGAHLNPAVTIAMAAAGKLQSNQVAGYLIAQMLGGVIGGALVFLFYREHFKVTDDADGKLGCFCTAPNIRNLPQAFFCEVLGTFLLILPIFLMTQPSMKYQEGVVGGEFVVGLGTIGSIPVGLLVFAIGVSLGGTTGYAINPARDLGPRIAHFLLPVPGKRDSDWSYAWVPVIGPIVGALLAALVEWSLR
ncbi:MAG TPA: MIP/aquaporin family protein [Chthoniobacteraceae bacterium]|jgi:glycerol uptake facilitator protein|nr:MIP/aquaporin family protein [Chthoniobacteraceae bacterium]